jgi:hypothetical protein
MGLAWIDDDNPVALECGYEEGTFGQIWARDEVTPLEYDEPLTVAAVAYHEAGHAVLSTVLRMGVSNISIYDDGDACGHWIAGVMKPATSPWLANQALIYKGDQGAAMREVIVDCAGRAAERRFLFERGLFFFTPFEPTYNEHDDPGHVDRTEREFGLSLVETSFREEGWAEVQRAIDDPLIWRAICMVADSLAKAFNRLERDFTRNAEMSGACARAIMRRAAVRPGCWAPRIPVLNALATRRSRFADIVEASENCPDPREVAAAGEPVEAMSSRANAQAPKQQPSSHVGSVARFSGLLQTSAKVPSSFLKPVRRKSSPPRVFVARP